VTGTCTKKKSATGTGTGTGTRILTYAMGFYINKIESEEE